MWYITSMSVDDFNKEELKTEPLPEDEYIKPATQTQPREYGRSELSKKIAKVTSIVITVVGAGLVLGGILEYSFVYKPTAVVEQFVVTADDDHIYYDIVIKDMKPETLTLKVYNQFTNRKQTIIMGQNTGSFEGLATNMEYTVSIIEKDVLVSKKKIVTKYVEPKESESL